MVECICNTILPTERDGNEKSFSSIGIRGYSDDHSDAVRLREHGREPLKCGAGGDPDTLWLHSATGGQRHPDHHNQPCGKIEQGCCARHKDQRLQLGCGNGCRCANRHKLPKRLGGLPENEVVLVKRSHAISAASDIPRSFFYYNLPCSRFVRYT